MLGKPFQKVSKESEEIKFKVLLGVELSVTRVCVKMLRLVVGDRFTACFSLLPHLTTGELTMSQAQSEGHFQKQISVACNLIYLCCFSMNRINTI